MARADDARVYEIFETTADGSMRLTDRVDSNATDAAIKKVVTVNVTFLKIGEVNTLKEMFEADVLLKVRWREPKLDRRTHAVGQQLDTTTFFDPKIFIENCVHETKVTKSLVVEYLSNGEAYVIERRRVKGSFSEQLELWDFPFDVQDLTLYIMSDLSAKDVHLVEDPLELHKIQKQSFIDEQEWHLYKHVESDRKDLVKDPADPLNKHATLIVRCIAARRPAYFAWNIFSLTFLISMMAVATFSVDKNLPHFRLQLTFTLILTSVTFKFIANQSIPKISYLTYLDRYIQATMVMLTIVSTWHAVQVIIPDQIKNDYIAITVFGCTYGLWNIAFMIQIYVVVYRKRREMKRREAAYLEKSIELKSKGQPTVPSGIPGVV